MKRLWFLYLIPNLYLVIWLQWFSYGMLAAVFSFILAFLPLGLGMLFLQLDSAKPWIMGSILQFAMNVILTLLTMQWDPKSPHGGSWNGMMEIMGALEFVIVMTFVLLFLVIVFVYPLVLASGVKKK